MYVLGQHLIKIIVINLFCSSATYCVIFFQRMDGMFDSVREFYEEHKKTVNRTCYFILFLGYLAYMRYALHYDFHKVKTLLIITILAILGAMYTWFTNRFWEKINATAVWHRHMTVSWSTGPGANGMAPSAVKNILLTETWTAACCC